MSEELATYTAVTTLRTEDVRNPEHLYLTETLCTACGGQIYAVDDHESFIYCGVCKTTNTRLYLVFLAALAWLKVNEPCEVQNIRITDGTDLPEDEWPPFTPRPVQLWEVEITIDDGDYLLWAHGPDAGPLTVEKNTFAACPADACLGWVISTDANGIATCTAHGPVAPWGTPVEEYADDPEMSYAADLAKWTEQQGEGEE